MNFATFELVLALITFCNCYKEHYENVTSEISVTEDLSNTVLSRRKRFVIFPDGSSFQLVFCTQTHGYLQVGDIVWFGSTAALAWELPSDPSVFNMFKEQRPIVNPAFAKRSVDFPHTPPLSIKKMHDMQKSTNYLNDLHENSIEFHRTGRKSLYAKVEKVLQALGWNGTECVLRMLCESGKEKKDQGTFLGEIVRATFTLPQGREFEAGYKRYDAAQGGRDCPSLYPGCEDLHGLSLYDQIQETP
ncbi:Uncharacterized protein OBRU01_17555 [Operophtera brumata]|uniref:Uncharacterized protein n=1 Tax=Operophtera brumata TaxID=104452 RepID=A0A0L7L0W4_OPEBR|nr:Uncharacterized protein OBRU01_17555 [Operophtera brumata]